MISATYEVKARGALTIGVGDSKFSKENLLIILSLSHSAVNLKLLQM